MKWNEIYAYERMYVFMHICVCEHVYIFTLSKFSYMYECIYALYRRVI
jgi:hypothetical protein